MLVELVAIEIVVDFQPSLAEHKLYSGKTKMCGSVLSALLRSVHDAQRKNDSACANASQGPDERRACHDATIDPEGCRHVLTVAVEK